MILITGATGNLGSSVIAQLQTKLRNEEFVVTSSNAEGMKSLTEKGLNARFANFSDADSLNGAFEGVSKVLLISTMEQNRFEQHKNVVDAAVEQGVKHIYYTGLSVQNIETSAVKDLMISHFQTEDYIKERGLTFTFLRNSMYADALVQILGPAALEKNIELPGGNGNVPYALRREMGEGIANALLTDGHDNKTYDITGGENYNYVDVAKELSELTGKEIAYTDVDEAAFANVLKQIGFPDFLIYLHAGTIKDIKEGQYETATGTLAELLGRPTASLKEMIKELYNI